MRDKSEQVEYDREYRQEHKAKLAEYRQSYKIKIVIRMNNTEPFIGEIRKGWEIGYSRLCKYIWRSCLSCGKLQWIEFIKGKPRSVRCKGCASAKNNKDRIIPRTINNNLPSVGEIRKGRNIEGCNELKAVEIIKPVHAAQLLSYMKLSGKQLGLLINFNVLHLKEGIQRFIL